MATYRLYHVRGGHFWRSDTIEADDDEEAVLLAKQHLGEVAAELWCRDRKVTIFAAPPEAGERT